MKNIVIITYCTSSNSGTFLQAYAVGRVYEEIFPDCRIRYIKARRIGGARKKVKNDMSRFHLFITKTISYLRNHYYLHISKKYFHPYSPMPLCFEYDDSALREIYDNNDVVSIGSDTILERFAYNGKTGLMWGLEASRAKKVIFAASGDNCSLLYGERDTESIKRHILDFDFIGIRDNILLDFFVNRIGIERSRLHKQPDPTYYLPLSIFNVGKILHSRLLKAGKIVMFHFDRSFKYRPQLAALIKSMGYKLVTPEYDPCCDISLGIISPFQWGDLFRYCDAVFTERFHDTVFSLRHCVPVVNVDWNKSKVSEFGDSKRTEILKQYGLEKYHLSIYSEDDISCDIVSNIRNLLDTFDKHHVSMVNEELIKSMQQSINILRDNLVCS